MTTTTNTLLETALSYARRGWHVFPVHTPFRDGTCDCKNPDCDNVGKHPWNQHGLNEATIDETTIKNWWAKWPVANIGIRTGFVSGFFVLDIDTKEDAAGDESLRDLETQHGKLPDTVEAITGSGGRHILFVHPKQKVKNSVRSLGAGIDVRGDGGYIIAAPSLHRSGGHYQWELSGDPEVTPLGTAPEWLLSAVQEEAEGIGYSEYKASPPIAEKVREGGRNNALASVAGTMRRRGVSQEAILAALLAINEAQCDPPLPANQVEGIAKSISRYEPSEPLEQPATLDSTRPVLDELREIDGKEAVRKALEPETLGALALAAREDRASFESLLMDLRASGARARDVDALQRAIKGELRKTSKLRLVQPEELAKLPKIRDVISHAPVIETAVIPPGWRVTELSVAKESASGDDHGQTRTSVITVAPTPIVITGRLKDVSDGSESVRLAFLRDGQWQQHTTSRAVVANARSLVELAGVGLPVTSGTAGDVSAYIAAFEAANMPILPKARVSRQMGWQGKEGEFGFLWGRTLIRPDGEQIAMVDVEAVAPEDWKEDWIAFHANDSGDDQLADGYYARGNFEDWCNAVAKAAPYPRALLALYTAFVPPLLMPLECVNFAADWSNMTSTGKTTVLRMAASVWGNPDERSPAAALSTWDASRVWIERAATVLNGLPLILDDTKRAKNTKMVAQMIYDATSGRGKGRGSTRGTRNTGTWQTVLLSSGEVPMTSFSEEGGTHTRVLTVWGVPFQRTNAEAGAIVREITLNVMRNFGIAGPMFIQYLQSHRKDWPEWRKEFQHTEQEYLKRGGDSAVSGRLAKPFAAIDLTAALVHAALDLPWAYSSPIDPLYESLISEAMDADRAAGALTYILDWARANQPRFWGRHPKDNDGEPRTPQDGWAGEWNNNRDWDYLAFVPHRLRQILDQMAFDTEAIIRTWADRGWLKVGKGRKNDCLVRIHNEPARVIAIKREAFTAVDPDVE